MTTPGTQFHTTSSTVTVGTLRQRRLVIVVAAVVAPLLVWLVVALVGLALSLALPLSGTDTSIGDRSTLLLMHLAVAAILIPGLAGTIREQT